MHRARAMRDALCGVRFDCAGERGDLGALVSGNPGSVTGTQRSVVTPSRWGLRPGVEWIVDCGVRFAAISCMHTKPHGCAAGVAVDFVCVVW